MTRIVAVDKTGRRYTWDGRWKGPDESLLKMLNAPRGCHPIPNWTKVSFGFHQEYLDALDVAKWHRLEVIKRREPTPMPDLVP